MGARGGLGTVAEATLSGHWPARNCTPGATGAACGFGQMPSKSSRFCSIEQRIELLTTWHAGSVVSLAGETLSLEQPHAASPARFEIGASIADRYVVLRALGRGGMGEVYEVLDEQLGEHVALKTLRPELAALPHGRERFRREVQLARKVTHPNACRLFELGVANDVAFFTMELLGGETLAARCADKPLGLEEVRRIALALVDVLAAAHAAGVVHGDLTPSNVILDGERVVVTDFGLARAFGESGEGYGTAAYMAPEQLANHALGPATDVFAVALVIARALTGRPVFRGTREEIVAARLARPAITLPPMPWRPLLQRCLAHDPRERPSVRELSRGLRRTKRSAWLAAGAGATVAGAIALVAGHHHPVSVLSPPPALAAADYEEGLAALRVLDYQHARAALTRAIAKAPAYAPAHAALADAAWAIGDEVGARAEAKEAVEVATDGSRAEQLLAEAHMWEANGAASKAAAVYGQLVAVMPMDIDLAYAKSRAEWHAGDTAAARVSVAALPEHDPRRLVAELHFATASGDWTHAKATSEQLLEAANRLHAPGLAFEARIGEAEGAWALGDLARAETAFGDAAALAAGVIHDPNGVAGTRYLLGRVQLDAGHIAAARESFSAITTTGPDGRGTFANRADGLAMVALAAGDLDAATRANVDAELGAKLGEGRGFQAARAARVAARIALSRHDLVAAREAARRAVDGFRALSFDGDTAYALTVAAEIALASGELDDASTAIAEARAIWAKRGAALELGRCDRVAAAIAFADGRPHDAIARARAALAAPGSQDDRALALHELARALAPTGDREAPSVAREAAAAASSSERPDIRGLQ